MGLSSFGLLLVSLLVVLCLLSSGPLGMAKEPEKKLFQQLTMARI